MDNLTGRVAAITGGASGIGLATARALAKEGVKLALADIEVSVLDKAVAELSSEGAEVIGLQTDVGDQRQVQAFADRTFDHYGKCHILFNNAGVAVFGPIQDMTHEDWEWSMRVNLWGPIYGVEAFLPRIISQNEGGHIVSTASFAGLVPNSGLGVYCVTKYGVVALSECLARDLKPHNIGASVLCPMRVETNINESYRNRPDELGGTEAPAARPQETGNEDLAGRVIQVGPVADLVVDAIRTNKLYIHTHTEAREFVERRFSRIDQAFEGLSL